MSWLADRTGIHMNLRPLAAPAGAVLGGLVGGPLGASLGAGLFKTGDNLAHHDSLGHALGQGALNAGLTYAGGKGLEQLRGAFSPSSAAPVEGGAAGSVAGASAPPSSVAGLAGAGTIGDPGLSGIGAGAAHTASLAGQQAPSWVANALSQPTNQGNSFANAARGIGSFIKDNPNTIGQGLQGLGAMRQADSMNRLRQSQADQQDYELGIQKSRDIALEPLRRALAGQFSGMMNAPRVPFPANPYSQR